MAKNNKDSDLYQNKEATQALISEINKVAVKGINDLSTQVADAVKQLKNVHGIENVGTINPRKYNAFFDNISTDLNSVSKRVTQNDEAIDDYSNAGVGTRLISTGAMGFFKFGEGLLSVGEDLGDGAASLVGWLAPKDSKLEKACTKFVKKNWSHDVFNFYYKSDFAKKSYMKEDSVAANCFKIAGTCVGYLYAGGAAAGVARGAATGVSEAAAKGAAKNLSKLATKTSKIRDVASTTTKANTLTMGVGGVGHGTEEGLLEGNSINKAFRTKGLKEGAIGAGLGFGGGKLGEVLSKRSAIKAAQNELKTVENKLKDAAKNVDKAKTNLGSYESKVNESRTALDAEKNAGKEAVEEAQKKVEEQTAKFLDKESALKSANRSKNAQEGHLTRAAKAEEKATTVKDKADAANKYNEQVGKVLEREKNVRSAQNAKNAQKRWLDNALDNAKDKKANVENAVNEKIAKAEGNLNSKIKDLNKATDKYSASQKTFKEAEEAKQTAKETLDAVKNRKASSFEGYTDKFTKSGEKIGSSLKSATKSGAKAIRKGPTHVVKTASQNVTNTASKFAKAAAKRKITLSNIKPTIKATANKPGIVETLKSGQNALVEKVAASRALRQGSIEANSLSASAAEKTQVFKDNVKGIFSRGDNSIDNVAAQGIAVPAGGIATSASKLSGLKGMFTRGTSKIDDINKVQRELNQAKMSLKAAQKDGTKEELEYAEELVKNKTKQLDKLIEKPLPGAVAATVNATHNTKTDPIPSYLNDEGTGADTGAETVDDSSTDETQTDESQTDTTETNTGSDSGYSSGSYSDGGGDYSSSYDDSSTSPEDTTTETPTEDTTEQPQETETEETTTDETQTEENQTDETQNTEQQTEETQTEETQPTDQTETNPEDTYTETTQTDTKDGTVTTTTPTKSADYDDSYYDDSSYNDSNDNMEEFVDSEKADEGQLIDDTNSEEEMEEEQIYDEPVEETETDENTEVLDDLPLPTSTKKKGNIAIPLIAGIATAGAAGTGAKIYLDRKKNKDNLDDEYEYEEDEDYDYDEDSIDDVYQEEQESTDIATEAIDEGERYTSKPNSEFEDFI